MKVFRDEFTEIRGDQRDEFCKIREGERDWLRTIPADREDGFVQRPKRKTCKRQEKSDELTSVNRSNKFDVLNLAERGLEVEEVKAVDVVQEIVKIIVNSGAAKSVWPIRQKGVRETGVTKTVRLAAASASPIHVEGDTRLEFVWEGKKCNMKFLDAEIKRPLVSVSVIVDEGHIVVFGPQESHVENRSTGQRIPMNRRQGVFVVQLDARAGTRSMKTVKFHEPNTNSVFSGARDPTCGRKS